MRIAAILLVIGLAVAASTSEDAFSRRAADFNVEWNLFYRKYLGCPKGAREVEECRPQLGVLDRKRYDRARRAAMKLFDQ